METKKLEKFEAFKIKQSDLLALKGGLSLCKQAAPYACEAAGWKVGTRGFRRCTVEVYEGCDAYDA